MKRSGLAAIALAAALALAGCGGDSEEPSSPEQKEPKKAEEKEPASPSPPEDADEQAAIEAIETWIDTSNEMTRTLDPATIDRLESLSTDSCMACELRVEDARELAKEGGEYKGDFEEEAQNFRPTGEADSEDQLQFFADVRTGDYQKIGSGGTVESSTPATEDKIRYVVQREGDQWLVEEVVNEQGG